MASTEEIWARKHLTDYFWDYNDVRRMNTITNANVKCVATLETGSGLDKYGQARIGSRAWFFRHWKILNPQVDTPMAKKHRDGVLEDVKKMLKLSESQGYIG